MAIGSKEALVYWVNLAGELMLAPDTRMRPFIGWNRVECTTVGEIEQFSRRMAQQEFQRFKSLKVEEHLRASKRREELKANCKLRLAKGCISAADEHATKMTLKNLERKDAMLYKLLTEEPDLTRGCLTIEKEEAKIGPAAWQGKRKGLADGELGLVAALAGSTR